MPRAPEDSYTLGLEYDLPVSQDFGDLTVGLTYRFTGDSTSELGDILGNPVACPPTPCPGTAGTNEEYGLTDVRLSYMAPNGNWDLIFWGKNITDEEYFSHLITNGSRPVTAGVHRAGMPATYGATLTVSF